MAAGNVAQIIHASGRVVADPTLNLANSEYPHGGTELGLVMSTAIQPLGTSFRVQSEGLGETTEILEGDNRYVVAMFFRGMDDDAQAKLFPGAYSVGAETRHAVYSEPGTRTPGQASTDRALTLLFVPDDVVNVDGFILYSAIPDFQDGAELFFSRDQEFGFPIAFECLRDKNDRILSIGRLADLTL